MYSWDISPGQYWHDLHVQSVCCRATSGHVESRNGMSEGMIMVGSIVVSFDVGFDVEFGARHVLHLIRVAVGLLLSQVEALADWPEQINRPGMFAWGVLVEQTQ